MEPFFKHFLIATDGSESSDKAVRVGLELAARLGADAEILNVLEYGEEPADPGLRTRLTMLRDIDRHHGKLALEQAAELARKLGVGCRTLQPTGLPEQVIVQKAPDFDLIVLGTHGRSGVKRWVMGSVAEAVLSRSPKPVLVVHESYTPPILEPEAAPYQNLLIATDGSDCSQQATEYGLRLAKALGAEVTFLSVVSMLTRPQGAGLALSQALSLVEEEAQTQAEAMLEQARAKAQQAGVSARVKLMQGRPVDAIVKQALLHDLLLMGTHGRTGLDKLMMGSVAEGVVRRSQTPVLVVPCPEA
ncbi:universal stress protein [Meiothermus sp.]|uniref:universal stress protein n=1 Tax=Meiothermus sp. TaxID=1955249 RepID=UPI00307DA801